MSEQGGTWVREVGTRHWKRASAEEAQRMVKEFTISGVLMERQTVPLLLTILLSKLVTIL